MVTTNADIIAEKKNYEIHCKKCDFILPMRHVTLWYAERNLEMYNSLKSVSNAPCDHDLRVRET